MWLQHFKNKIKPKRKDIISKYDLKNSLINGFKKLIIKKIFFIFNSFLFYYNFTIYFKIL